MIFIWMTVKNSRVTVKNWVGAAASESEPQLYTTTLGSHCAALPHMHHAAFLIIVKAYLGLLSSGPQMC